MKKIITVVIFALLCVQAEAKKVKMTVDMRGQIKNATGIHVFGDFQAAAGFAGGDWIPGSTVMTQELADTNLYSVVFDAPAFHLYMYQFINGDQSYEVEFVPIESRVLYQNIDYRWFYLDSLNNDTTVMAPIRFGRNAPQDKFLLRYRVDMQNISGGVSSKGVHTADTLNGWNATTQRMYSFDGKVYEYITYTDSLPIASMQYIFVDGDSSADYEVLEAGCGSNGVRSISFSKDSMLPVVCYTACSACIPNKVEALTTNNAISIFPNPSNGMFFIKGMQQIRLVEVRDLLGRVVLTRAVEGGADCKLDLSNESSGVYFVTVFDENTLLSKQRIIKE